MHRRASFSFFVCAIVGCTSPSLEGTDSVDASVPPLTTAAKSTLRTRFQLAPSTTPLIVENDGRRTARVRAVASRGIAGHELTLPARADRPVRLADERSGLALDFSLEGASSVEPIVEDGLVVYPHAFGPAVGDPNGGDVVHRAFDEGVEDWVVLAAKPSVEELRYRVSLSKVSGLRLVANVFELVDKSGAPRLRVAPPRVIDKDGVSHDATLAIEGCAYDSKPLGPWARPIVPPGSSECTLVVRWSGIAYPAIVDPSWVTTGAMTVARRRHTATLLAGGKVLVAGGDNGAGSALSACDLYDPTSGTFAATGSLAVPHAEHAAIESSPGKVLLVGGSTVPASSNTEVYDATAGTWSNTGNPSKWRGSGHTLTKTGSSVLVIGSSVSPYTSTTELWNGSTWSAAGNTNGPRMHHFAAPWGATGVIAIGGDNGTSALSTAEIWDSATSTWTLTTSNLSGVRTHLAGVAIGTDKILVFGGRGSPSGGAGYSSVEEYTSTGFTLKAPMVNARGWFTASLLPSGDILAVGGNGGSGTVSAAERYNPTADSWTLAGYRTSHGQTATVLNDGRVLITGGERSGTNALSNAELYLGPQPNGATCVGSYDCTSGICVDGYCCDTACTGACLSCSSTPGTCSKVLSADDPGTCWGTTTCDAAGDCKKKNGQTCTGATECASGNCVDGVCCNTACTGACDACNIINGTCSPRTAGSSGAPSCAPYVCNGSSADCITTCTNDASCATGNYCAADGTCKPKKAQGTACSLTTDCKVSGCAVCDTGNCVDGVCCNTACGNACDTCLAANGAPSNGTCGTARLGYAGSPSCSPLVCTGSSTACPTTCTSDAQCATTHYCAPGGTCRARKTKGAVCNTAAGADCLVNGCRACDTAGGCVDGRCCDGACNGSCDVCAAALGATSDGTCTNVAKGSAGSPSCAPYFCSGTSNACTTTCASDTECTANAYCDTVTSTCRADQPLGSACTRTAQCASGFCVDGVCCDEACNGTCRACAASMKADNDPANSGRCGAAANGTDPHSSCAADPQSTCQQDGVCDGAGACRKWPRGTSCGSSVCLPGNIVSGQICDGFGACGASSTGGTSCAPYVCSAGACKVPCTADTDCVAGNYCNSSGSCVPKVTTGDACAANKECASGFCVDGVCCATSCDGLCQACSAARKESGADSGTCGPAKTGTDPRDQCPDDGAPSCDRDGTCDGKGACRVYAAGATCNPAACTGDATSGFKTTAYECDGAGTCAPKSTGDCGLYKCSSATCGTSCTADTDCIPSAYCSAGVCKAKAANATACTVASECASGFCIDGVCCDAACNGQCEACDVKGAEGKCSLVVGDPHPPRAACAAGTASEPCIAAKCDGVDRAKCSGFVGSDVTCREASCKDGFATPTARCDGKGACPPAESIKCEPFVCQGNACGRAPCNTDSDCAPKFRCDQSKKDCIAAESTTCVDDATQGNVDGSRKQCSPYRCVGAECLTACRSTGDCLAGFVCDTSSGAGVCTPVATTAEEGSEGCGCSTPGRSGERALFAGVALAIAVAVRRRRRN